MKCANCGLEIFELHQKGSYGESYQHTNTTYTTCIYANYNYKINWHDTRWCDYEGHPYIASLTKGEVTRVDPDSFPFVIDKTSYWHLPPYERALKMRL